MVAKHPTSDDGIDRPTRSIRKYGALDFQAITGKGMLLNDRKGWPRKTRRACLGSRRPGNPQAFTFVELLIMVVLLGLGVMLALPALANNKERSLRLLCLNNLRRTGQGIAEFETEHGGRVSWRTPYTEGGTMHHPSGLNNNVWFQWYVLSNYLQTPKILVCPSDATRRIATAWEYTVDSGFSHPNRQNWAVSYFTGLDVLPEDRLTLLAGDRNLRFSVALTSCSSGVAPCSGITSVPHGIETGIDEKLHVGAGNFLLTDGRVEELSSQSFAKWIYRNKPSDDNGYIHFLTP